MISGGVEAGGVEAGGQLPLTTSSTAALLPAVTHPHTGQHPPVSTAPTLTSQHPQPTKCDSKHKERQGRVGANQVQYRVSAVPTKHTCGLRPQSAACG